MSLNIVPADILSYISQLFNTFWPLLVIGLAFLAFPMVIGGVKTIFSRRRA